MPALSPYETAKIFGKVPPTHILEDAVDDLNRVNAYETYEDIFHNVSEVFSVVIKTDAGNEVFRRLVPSARSIVEGTNRYLAQGLTWAARPPSATSSVDPLASDGANAAGDAAVSEAMQRLEALFKREMFLSTFLSAKRWMLIRGDAMWHLTVDPSKPESTRLRIAELNPGTYFPVLDPADSARVIGCYLVNLITDDEDEDIAARLEYRRILDTDMASTYGQPLGTVYYRLTFWEADGWDDRRTPEDLKPAPTPARFNAERLQPLLEGSALDARITAIPVYHIRNNPRGNEIFGTSEIQGIETLIAGISQTATDEEIALALQSLGVFWTDSGKAIDSNGNEVDWMISPATMMEIQDGKRVGRLEGISSVQPSLDHMNMLKSEARETTGTPDLAVGSVDVSVAESGVALAIRMAPMTAKNAEKELELSGRLDQFLYDLLNGWLPAYEGYSPVGVTVESEFAPALPVNPKEVVEWVVSLVEKKIVSAAWARNYLADKLGLTFGSEVGAEIADETSALLDATGARLDAAVADAPLA